MAGPSSRGSRRRRLDGVGLGLAMALGEREQGELGLRKGVVVVSHVRRVVRGEQDFLKLGRNEHFALVLRGRGDLVPTGEPLHQRFVEAFALGHF